MQIILILIQCTLKSKRYYFIWYFFICRPLPDEMVRYAREDTHYLLYIYDRLHDELLKSGNANNNLLQSVYSRSKQICLKVCVF